MKTLDDGIMGLCLYSCSEEEDLGCWGRKGVREDTQVACICFAS